MNNKAYVQDVQCKNQQKYDKMRTKQEKERDESAYSFAKENEILKSYDETAANQRVQSQNKNLWPQQPIPNPALHGSNLTVPDEKLGDSSRTYVSIVNVDSEPPTEQNKKSKRLSNRTCRIIQGATVLFVLCVLGLIAYFIASNLLNTDSCDGDPSVDNGKAVKNQKQATVSCDPGYGPDENQTVTCEDGEWKTKGFCPLTGCGTFPKVDNGSVTGLKTNFGSTGRLQCDPGFIPQTDLPIACMSNGSWMIEGDLSCIPLPCGPLHLSDNVLVKDDFSQVNMSINMKCDDGFVFANEDDTSLLCENKTWIGNPTCIIPGTLKLETTHTPVLTSGNSFTVACDLKQSPNWDKVMLSRKYLANDSSEIRLCGVANDKENGIKELQYDARIKTKVIPLQYGVNVEATIDHVHCDDTGVYICAVLVGDIKQPKGIKTDSKLFKVIDTSSEVNEIIAPTAVVQGDKINVKCIGTIGRDDDGIKVGRLSVRILKNSHFEIIPSTIESSEVAECQIDEIINSTISVTNAMDGAELQCIVNDDDALKIKKKSVLLEVKKTTVRLSTSLSTVYMGDNVSLTADFNHIRGWRSILFEKHCNGSNITIGSLQNNPSTSNLTTEDHMNISESNITDSSAKIVLTFTGVKCSDACFEGGKIEYTSSVELGDSWEKGSVTLEFRVNPTKPVLKTEQEKFYLGQEAILKCQGNVGIPNNNMTMTDNSVQPQTRPRFEATIDTDTCENLMTMTYAFTVTKNHDGTAFQCEVLTTNGTLKSDIEIVNVSDPILYFTDDSMTGMVGYSKTIKCVLTNTANLTGVIISKYNTESKLCEINGAGSGTCVDTGVTVEGHYSDDKSIFNTAVTFKEVSCSDEVTYVCRSFGADFRTSMNFQVTKEATVPELRIPTTIVENQQSEWEDELNCTSDLGYSYSLEKLLLKIQIRSKGSDSFVDYTLIPGKKAEPCGENTTIIEKQTQFPVRYNGSSIRCAILDEENNVIKSSTEKEIKILKNACIGGNAGAYDPHPYDCKRYIRCVGVRLFDKKCAEGSCALRDTDPICSDSECAKCN